MKRPLRARRRSRSPDGFTLIEVMVSLGIMMIGAMAVIALQTQQIRVNGYARQVTTATQIAQIWIERLKQDGSTWTQVASPTGAPDDDTVLASTQYLKSITTQDLSHPTYVTPPGATNAPVSCGFDYRGNDTDITIIEPPNNPFYCAAYRLQWVYYGEAMRADVRVWWPKAGGGAGAELPTCGSSSNLAVLDPGGSAYGKYHVVYLSTVIRVTPLPR